MWRFRLLVTIFAVLLFAAAPAAAHKIRLFATVVGDAITGTVFFSGNAAARAVPIQIVDPAGRLLAETVSDADGRFHAGLAGPFDHRIIADTGDGHRAEFVLRVADFTAPLAAPLPTSLEPAAAALALPDDLERAVEQAVARQVAPLREQLDAFEQRVLWRDVLGGIGYIIGLFGLAAWLITRHKRAHGGTPAE
ncbi:MAG: hypothetical protein MUE49_06535 [Rhodospirillales bacterium]|nr:hypothetical protein [Rhodospirillales bacterium]